MIAEELGISTGNITYYFPTKEHLLLVVVEMLCDFQWKMIEIEADRGLGSVASICLELMTVAYACEENEIARDFFASSFQNEMCRNLLRNNHVKRAKQIFSDICADWTDSQFIEAEILVMGLQYSTIVTIDSGVELNVKIAGALHQILSIYNVEESVRRKEIQRVLSMDCRGLGKRVLREFIEYIKAENKHTFEELLRERRKIHS